MKQQKQLRMWHTFKVMKNKLKERNADNKQYEHEVPENCVLRMYKKQALAAAMEVVIPSKTKLASDFPIPKGKLFAANSCTPSVATNPYAIIPNNGRGTPTTFQSKITITKMTPYRKDQTFSKPNINFHTFLARRV